MSKNVKNFCAVIPTKNRQDDLLKIITSISDQKVLPEVLVIIDQSETNCKADIKKILNKKINLKYFHKRKIKSLTEAKNFSLSKIDKKIIFFLEDDVILQKNYFLKMISLFNTKKNIIGICGILINEKRVNFLSKLYNKLFLIGIFRDKRFLLWNYQNKEKFVISDKISGGVSAWRREVFSKVKFDKKNKLHLFEDIDFSIRVNKIWPKSTGILTSAKVVHKWSPTNRKKDFKLIQLKLIEAYKFYKKNKNQLLNFDLSIFIFGQFINCTIKTIIYLNFSYFKVFIKTILNLKKIKIYSK